MDSRLMDNHILVPVDGSSQNVASSAIDSGQFYDTKQRSEHRKKHRTRSPTKEIEAGGKHLQDLISSLAALKDAFGALHNDLKNNQSNALESSDPMKSPALLDPPAKTVQVFVSVIFVKLGEIDTLKETFSADVVISAKWMEPRLDSFINQTPIDGSEYWDPQLYVENLYGEGKETVWHMALNEQGRMMVCQKRRLKATFIETIELERFPFDTQDLHITIKSTLPETSVTIHRDDSTESLVNLESFVDQQEWLLQSNIETTELSGSPQPKSPRSRFSGISMSCKAKRRPGFFIWNILLVMIFICSLSFTTFSVDVDKPQNRLQLTFTLVLTMVTFKFIVNNSLPKISYLTYLDKYVLVTMGVLILIGIWHSVIGTVYKTEDPDSVKEADKIALVLIGISYVIFNLVFAIYVFVKVH